MSRLQRSVRGILSTSPRGAERQTEGTRGSTARRLLLDEGEDDRVGRQGCEALHANVTGNAKPSLGRKAEIRADGRRLGLMDDVAFNRAAAYGVLAS